MHNRRDFQDRRDLLRRTVQAIPHLIRTKGRQRLVIALAIVGAAVVAAFSAPSSPRRAAAQEGPTAIPLVIVTVTPTEARIDTLTPTRTPTAYSSQLRVEANDASVGANIRSGPGVDYDKVGNIRPGQFFPVVSIFDQWLQIQFPPAPSGLGWVYSEIVNISGGDLSALPTYDRSKVPTRNADLAQLQATLDYITATPGAIETATALQAIATGIFSANGSNDNAATAQRTAPPTYTEPPPLIEATLPARGVTVNRGDLPPIVPILAFGALGVGGLLIAGLRRLGA